MPGSLAYRAIRYSGRGQLLGLAGGGFTSGFLENGFSVNGNGGTATLQGSAISGAVGSVTGVASDVARLADSARFPTGPPMALSGGASAGSDAIGIPGTARRYPAC